jgi:hypothetical protein
MKFEGRYILQSLKFEGRYILQSLKFELQTSNFEVQTSNFKLQILTFKLFYTEGSFLKRATWRQGVPCLYLTQIIFF